MLYIEKGGEAQIEDELRAYNPLIPQGHELTATVMFEIDDPIRRGRFCPQALPFTIVPAGGSATDRRLAATNVSDTPHLRV